MSFLNRCVKDFIIQNRVVCAYYDLSEIERNARLLRSLADDRIRFIFPVKSFPKSEVLGKVADILGGFDVSNQTEWEQVEPLKKENGLVWSSSPVPWDSKVGDMFMDGAHLQAPWPVGAKRSLRVNLTGLVPEFISRFGSSLKTLSSHQLVEAQISALHFHHGEEPFNRIALPLAIDVIADLVRGNKAVTHVNLGGGLEGLTFPEIEEIVKRARRELPHQQIIFEPGRWLCGDAGKLIGRVSDVFLSDAKTFAMTTLSRDCHLRWQQSNFKVSIHPMGLSDVILASEIHLMGATCSESDKIAVIKGDDLGIARDDLLVVHRLPGYSSAWNHSFNGIPAADTVFFHQN